MNLTRRQIIEGTLQYPSELISLRRSRHFLSQLRGRGLAQNSIPSVVRITEGNIHSGKSEDGKTLSSVVVRLSYSYKRYLFLAIDPRDGTLKTLWFKNECTRKRKM